MYLLMLYNDHILPFSITIFDSLIQEILGAGRPNPLQTRVTFCPSLVTMLLLATVTDAETMTKKECLLFTAVALLTEIICVMQSIWQQWVMWGEICKIEK